MSNTEYFSTEEDQALAYIVHPEIVTAAAPSSNADDEIAMKIEEVEGLARAINLDVLKTHHIKLSKIRPSTLLGKGQCEDIAEEIEETGLTLVIVNHTLSPVQQRNLEKLWNVKVIDRTGLILEIFGARAQTKEGRLQVELAALEYQRSRLVRSWTHLERQRGATGFIGGPGETQIEIDRRLIGERITKLKKELEDVRRTRNLGRESRARVPLPVVSLVGYTNAGKSTLFNTLTGASVFAKDLLFATLDPTMRRLELPNGEKIVLSDTVGFISELPTHLIAAFRATLEHAVHSDLIVHVIDVSRPGWETQREDVITILEELGIEYEQDERVFELYNKIDQTDEDTLDEVNHRVRFHPRAAKISALKGIGLEHFLEEVAQHTARNRQDVTLSIPLYDGKALSWLYDHAEILEREDKSDAVQVTAQIEKIQLEKFKQHFKYEPQKEVVNRK